MNSDPDFATRWRENELPFSDRLYSAGEPPQMESNLNSGVLLTAPHALTHFRNNDSKGADRGTGGLAITLGEICNVSYLIENSGKGDPAWDDNHAFKNILLQKKPQLIMDLHGMRTSELSDVDLGLGLHAGQKERELVDLFLETFLPSNLDVTVGRIFNAGRENTITSWAQHHGMTAFQIELGANVRPPLGSAELLNDFIEHSSAFIRHVESLIT